MMRPEGERTDASLGDMVRSHWQRLVQGSALGGWGNSGAMWKGEPEREAAEWRSMHLTASSSLSPYSSRTRALGPA